MSLILFDDIEFKHLSVITAQLSIQLFAFGALEIFQRLQFGDVTRQTKRKNLLQHGSDENPKHNRTKKNCLLKCMGKD